MVVVAVADMFGISGRRGELAALLEHFERWAAGEPGCQRYTFAPRWPIRAGSYW